MKWIGQNGRAGSLRLIAATVLVVIAILGPAVLLFAQVPPPQTQPQQSAPLTSQAPAGGDEEPFSLDEAMVRLPLAAVLGAALALRPRRRGTPPRMPAVVQTQIILAVVGAVIMLVVGASLARAFGIVGAANLIRYRSKIDDPKDAGVMLCALAVGLAAGVGLYGLSIFSTVFLVAALAVIESFEPQSVKRFELHVKAQGDAPALRPEIEALLGRRRLEYELRTASPEEICYDVKVPLEQDIDRITNSILKVKPEGELSVEWEELKPKK